MILFDRPSGAHVMRKEGVSQRAIGIGCTNQEQITSLQHPINIFYSILALAHDFACANPWNRPLN